MQLLARHLVNGLVLVGVLAAAFDVHGADKNGVSPNAISVPSGPGSLEGLGESFQPMLNTGMARYTVNIALPAGIAGHTPSLSLTYDSGSGGGPVGIGWNLSTPAIRRRTDKGVPRYVDGPNSIDDDHDGTVDEPDEVDVFLGSDGEELVPLGGPTECPGLATDCQSPDNRYYLAKIQGSFIRYRRCGDHWEAHRKDGTRLDFGLTAAARIVDAASGRIYAWHLERATDTHGNVLEYEYGTFPDAINQKFLTQIRYGPGSGPWSLCYAAVLAYESRPDWFKDYRSGFEIRTTKRLSGVDVSYGGALIRRYDLDYDTHPHWSLLSRITQFGDDGTSSLPPTTFAYNTFEPPETVSAANQIIGCIGEPSTVVDSSLVELVDLNADGLPDLLQTFFGGGAHRAYVNEGVQGPEGNRVVQFQLAPEEVASPDGLAWQRDLSENRVHLADMDGDSLADLVYTTAFGDVYYFLNTGSLGWSARQAMEVPDPPPPAPFDSAGVRTADLDFDKRMDVVQSLSTGYAIWFNLGDGEYGARMFVDGAIYNDQVIQFSDVGVQFADLNGDRLSDVAKVTSTRVAYCPSLGHGTFDAAIEVLIPDEVLSGGPGGQLERARLQDINGDGVDDLIVERASGGDLWYWLNLGSDTWSNKRVITDLPAQFNPNMVIRWADMNGNGTTDLIYADSNASPRLRIVDLGQLVGGSAFYNTLSAIDNGYGRDTQISYRSTTDFYVDAAIAGVPWTTSVPFPVPVVSRTATSIGLDMDGFCNLGDAGDVYVTDYVYRDGYYDPLERQFQGFAFVKQIERGDDYFCEQCGVTPCEPRIPTLVTRYAFHTGAPDGIDNNGNGNTDEYTPWEGREEESLKGAELWRESTATDPDDSSADGLPAPDEDVFERAQATWVVRDLCTTDGGALANLIGSCYRTTDGRVVRHAVRTLTERTIIERLADPAQHKQTQTQSDLDPLGQVIFEAKSGDVSNSDDDLYTGYEYARNGADWIVDRVSRTFQTDGGPAGAFVSEVRNYYDGQPFVGLALGEVGSTGNLHRTESCISGGTVPPLTERSFAIGDPRDPTGKVDTLRQQFDEYGNPTTLRDANENDRIIEYDPVQHKFPITETIVLGDGSPDLVVRATYHYGFGKPLTISDFNDHVSTYTYDEFGRLKTGSLPGDDPDAVTHTYIYDLGAPISSISTIAHANQGDSPDVVTAVFFDGLGRKLGTFEAGGPAMTEVTLYNSRGQPWKVFQPYAGGDGSWSAPASDLPATVTTFDATARVIETISPADDANSNAIATRTYLPLSVKEYDGEDTNPGSPHYGTPKTLVYDGLDRLTEVQEVETLSVADSGTFITKYRYALPDRLAEIEDAKGNIKYMRYDGLGRRIFMNDLDRGHMTYTFDPAGNLLNTVDAKGQQIVYMYDGANRLLTEDYLDDASPLSLHRTPDVAYHYDQPDADHPELRNLKGKLAWVEDLTGAEFLSYDMRTNPETVVKRISQIEGGTKDYATVSYADSLGRVYQIIYPDGGVVRYEYDARGLLRTIPGFLNQATYYPSGQKQSWPLGNGVVTSYTYDPRLRLNRLFTQGAVEVLQDLNYLYDQADNITAINDARPLPPGDPRSQTAGYLMDNLYRLQQADGVGWSQEFDYDRLGNMAKKLSSDPTHPEEHIGSMFSGGVAGTFNRIGRGPGDPPGPHALTLADNGTQQRAFDYDANGNMTNNDGDIYTYDFADRLGKVEIAGQPTPEIRYLYDYTGRRVIKRVDGIQTTYISKLSEIRDGQMLNYVFAGDTRLARVDGMINPPDMVTQRIPLVEGWNLISFQVDPGTDDPAILLTDLNDNCSAVFGHNGSTYTRYVPGAGDNTLTDMLPNRGYWLYMAEPFEWRLEGPVSLTSVQLPSDTAMLVGFPGFAPRTATELETLYPAIDSIWTYPSLDFGWQHFFSAAPPFINTLKGMHAGNGCWLVCEQPTTLNPASGDPPLIAFYHGDYLGSTNTVSDSAGEIISEYLYYPFGRTHNEHDTGAPGSTSHYQFTGHELDSGTDLYYYLNRFYDPTTAHFLNADPVWGHLSRLHGKRAFTLFGYPQRLNLYSYVINSPISRIDPNGLWDIGFGWKASYKKVCAGSKVDVTPIDLKISTEGASARASFELGQALFKKLSVKGEVEIGVGWSGDKEIYGTSEYALGPLQGAHKIAYNLGSKDWNYSPEASAQFDVFAQNQFPAPGIELMVSVPDPTKSGLDVDSILENLIDDVEYTADISLGGGFSVEVSFTGAEVKAGLRAMEEFAESNEYDMGGKSASQYDVNTTNTQSTARAVWPPE